MVDRIGKPMDITNYKVDPCLHCGDDRHVKIMIRKPSPGTVWYHIQCLLCGRKGGTQSTIEAAIASWHHDFLMDAGIIPPEY